MPTISALKSPLVKERLLSPTEQTRLSCPSKLASSHPVVSSEKASASGGTGFRTYMRNYQSMKSLQHPLTREEVTIDTEDLMRNTHKSPFQNSVRDQTNYFLVNQKALEDFLNIRAAPQKTMNRRLKVKNSYMTIFPEYGLHENKKLFRGTQFQTIGTKLDRAEPINKEFYTKSDPVKEFYEELLKAKNMMTVKKK